jgi:methionyl-tRNA formyltransferase
MNKKLNIAFFGTPDRAVIALDVLKSNGIVPNLVVTQPDRPQGRKLVLTPPPAKVWAEKNGVPVLQPENLGGQAFQETLKKGGFDFFIVVAYGKIIKQEILDIPKYGCLNLHASLLPRLRGSSPIETALIADERETGVTIILMDRLMDHGPIVIQEKIDLPVWPLPADELARILVAKGGDLLAKAIEGLTKGTLKPIEQDHSKATLTKKISKEDGLVDLSADPYKNFLKFNAHLGWPGSYFFTEKNGKKTRLTITDAEYTDDAFIIKKVVPEGKKEISWAEFNSKLNI